MIKINSLYIKTLLVVCVLGLTSFVQAQTTNQQTATITVTFTPPTPAGNVYLLERKQSNGTWVQVVSGPQSPIIYKIAGTTVAGTYTFRVRARITSVTPNLTSDPSAEASCTLGPGIPTNVNATIAQP